MSELAMTAQRLRDVKNACEEFIQLWAIDCLMEESSACDRIRRDIERAQQGPENEKKHLIRLYNLYHQRGLDD
jgi:hypothetical protein